jgi:hypothetical protein
VYRIETGIRERQGNEERQGNIKKDIERHRKGESSWKREKKFWRM